VIVSALWRYPVKSFGGEALERADVEPWGIRGDRRWMLVDRAGQPVRAARHPRLVTIAASTGSGGLRLRAAGHPDLQVAAPVGGRVVGIGLRGIDRAVSAGDTADRWLRDVLDGDVRLVWLDDPTRREMTERHGGRPGDVLSFADAAPLLLASVPSLRQLDAWVSQGGGDGAPLSMRRFRPNLVVDGEIPAFAEDEWQALEVGDVRFRFAEHCDRCVVTTLDPLTGRGGKEPLRTLAAHRRWDGNVWFGVRVVPLSVGTIAVGDPVRVLSR
jgi:uncharacterized protein